MGEKLKESLTMRRKTQPIAFAAFVIFTGSAMAQSSVTLFGVADASLRYVQTDGKTNRTVGNNGYSASQIGLKGSEDLGGGLAAIFWLEADVSLPSGSSGTVFWGRQSWVGLRGAFGEVRLGRDYTPSYLQGSSYDPFTSNGIATLANTANYGLGTNASTTIRAANSASYSTPNTLGGFYSKWMASAGEGVSGAKYWGGRVGYADGPADVSFAIGSTDVGVANSKTSTGKLKQFGIGGSYDFGAVKLVAERLTQKSTAGLGRQQTNDMLGLIARAGGAGVIRAVFNRARQDYVANKFALGYVHNLSKRTALYGTASFIQNKSPSAAFSVASAPAATAGLRQTSRGLEAGIRLLF